jgi:hypothetical protein
MAMLTEAQWALMHETIRRDLEAAMARHVRDTRGWWRHIFRDHQASDATVNRGAAVFQAKPRTIESAAPPMDHKETKTP